jgi:FkbM family methyltransferase
VFAFEPNPRVYISLLKNLELNAAGNVVPLHMALGAGDALLGLTFDPMHSGVSHLVSDPATEWPGPGGTRFLVPVVTAAALHFMIDICLTRSVYVKVDVEGLEVEVLRSILRTPIRERIKAVIVEVDSKNLARFGDTPDSLYSLMNTNGFSPTVGPATSPHYDEVFRS